MREILECSVAQGHQLSSRRGIAQVSVQVSECNQVLRRYQWAETACYVKAAGHFCPFHHSYLQNREVERLLLHQDKEKKKKEQSLVEIDPILINFWPSVRWFLRSEAAPDEKVVFREKLGVQHFKEESFAVTKQYTNKFFLISAGARLSSISW